MAHPAEPLRTLDEAYKAVRDLAGVRVSLYFPGDVDRVRTFLETGSKDLLHVRTIHKNDRNPRIPTLERRIQIQRARVGQGGTNDKALFSVAMNHVSRPNTVFPGYDAFHVIVKVSRNKLPALTGTPHRPGENLPIEVQIATAVMHAWQGVEHDIVYKNIGAEPPSEDQIRLIDLFNGIIMTGQVALRQLEATMKSQDSVRASKHAELVRFPWELEAVISKFYESKTGQNLSGETRWTDLSRLLDMLLATEYCTVGLIKGFLGELEWQPHDLEQSKFKEVFPLRVLVHLCSRLGPEHSFSYCHQDGEYSNAHFWALQLVQTLNMAVYLDVAREFAVDLLFGDTCPGRAACPSIADFLDILHPIRPQTNGGISDLIVDFCKWALKHDHHFKKHGRTVGDHGIMTKLGLARDLPNKSLFALQKLATKAQFITYDGGLSMLPTWLLTLLHPHRSTHSDELLRRQSNLSGEDINTMVQGEHIPALGYHGSSSLNQLQAYFCPREEVNDDFDYGRWLLVGSSDLAAWEVNRWSSLSSERIKRLETPKGGFYQDLATRLNMTLVDVYQVVEEAKAWVQWESWGISAEGLTKGINDSGGESHEEGVQAITKVRQSASATDPGHRRYARNIRERSRHTNRAVATLGASWTGCGHA